MGTTTSKEVTVTSDLRTHALRVSDGAFVSGGAVINDGIVVETGTVESVEGFLTKEGVFKGRR